MVLGGHTNMTSQAGQQILVAIPTLMINLASPHMIVFVDKQPLAYRREVIRTAQEESTRRRKGFAGGVLMKACEGCESNYAEQARLKPAGAGFTAAECNRLALVPAKRSFYFRVSSDGHPRMAGRVSILSIQPGLISEPQVKAIVLQFVRCGGVSRTPAGARTVDGFPIDGMDLGVGQMELCPECKSGRPPPEHVAPR